eukprot:CAMPEP_0180759174 /NCGR_PEP_ID=MMETSP1038_2-20121128/35659_1 /TAXON_ID=632150 /ORGANISM="Azadinium spinosum, Strain 3D9" /LENGTH=193 /DNA_ID=CAMNT_0022793277 /DNA_START=68 /DNA_END=649 /DNA_ORIENTATION=-
MTHFASNWEERGLPVRRLRNIQAAAELDEQWTRCKVWSFSELRTEYGKLGLPKGTEVPLKGQDLIDRLKQAALWKALSWTELVREWHKLEMRCPVEDPCTSVPLLMAAAWCSARTKKRSGSEKPGKATPQRDFDKYFETLELPLTADAEDVKKAYKRLALLYHPDKNTTDSPEEATRKFQEVNEAYEALCALN